jgi:chaperonin GroEL
MGYMAAKQLLFHSQAHAKFLAGMGILANAVRATLGPKARTVILDSALHLPGARMYGHENTSARRRKF